MSAWGAVVLILLGVGVHTLAEFLYAAGSFELRYTLALPTRRASTRASSTAAARSAGR
ncbi:hypothetical protein [Streptomyces camelliae]|uniref:Uncharacterized protein n=1 Tax=Streptomyces camelliae TaxID=3004093 RepID=A0ABY7PFV0_9ACTN|nr:hypothetical protein [Streptomyces sp. HUAS 2-6]WBO68380.1 hypothetical protein O1G22_38980 [Streptomyces sp. HUAS 2-6]